MEEIFKRGNIARKIIEKNKKKEITDMMFYSRWQSSAQVRLD